MNSKPTLNKTSLDRLIMCEWKVGERKEGEILEFIPN